ncbi:MAG TPA: deoxyguanosinetriphosphate triphosphohydrolase [Candidatus Limnocylindrales bacterium]|nr:deoxyguanosinetriphosphate triphosphohydrolase [Candidatus Limnocylindrales bacterium]
MHPEVSAIETLRTYAPWALDTAASRGRRFAETPHAYRSEYARDRDRIIHSRAFRRLEAKTQVFSTRFSDHFRDRLTHTLEVAQIARAVAAALRINTELVEALALVHDIGHPPFGHAGERKLDELMRAHGSGFDHNLHALRIVEHFEHRYIGFDGLNLSFEVREGIVKHSRDYSAAAHPELAEYLLELRPPLESQLIDWVDEIAYNSADLDDALEAKLLDLDTLREEVPLFAQFYAQVESAHPGARVRLKFNEALRHVIDHLVSDLITNTETLVEQSGAHSAEEIRNFPQRLARFSEEARAQNAQLKGFLFAHIYNHPLITEDSTRSVVCLAELFTYYLEQRGSLPESQEHTAQQMPRHLVVCDYIAGMTDQFLLRQHQEQFGANARSVPPSLASSQRLK